MGRRSMLAVSGTVSLRLRLARAVCGPAQPFGAGMLRRGLYPRAVGRSDDLDFVVRARTGSLFRGSTSDHHAYEFAVHGYGEWRLWVVALALCRPGDTIAEVGANVGTETVGYSDIVGPAGRVLAIEPLASNQRALRSNVALLRHDNVTLHPYALGDMSGTVPFAAPPAGGSSGIGHVLGPQERRSRTVTYRGEAIQAAVQQVEMRTLDSLADGDVRLIAMDAEGSEVHILRGAAGTIQRAAPAIVLEANPWHQARAGGSLRTLHEQLRQMGYRSFEVGHLSIVEISRPRGGDDVQTWLALPRAQAHAAGRVERLLRRCALTPCIGALNPLCAAGRRPRGHEHPQGDCSS